MFARNRGGAYVRNGPSPVQPRTVYQNSVRAALSMASIGWGSLSDSNRMAWREWAKLNPIKNRIGQSVTLQANAAYVQLNARLAHLGIAMGTTPPTVGAPTGLITLSLGADIGAGDFEVVYTATPLGANKRLISRAATSARRMLISWKTCTGCFSRAPRMRRAHRTSNRPGQRVSGCQASGIICMFEGTFSTTGTVSSAVLL